jgi:hypothetical protein
MAIETQRSEKAKLNRLYKTRDGEVTQKLDENVTGVLWETIKGGLRVEIDLEPLFPNGLPEPCVGLAAAAFGLNTSVGNVVGPMSDPVEMAKAMQARVDVIMDGEWRGGRETGPRTKYVLEAWAEYFSGQGYTVTEAATEKMRAKIVGGETSTKELLDDPAIRAIYDRKEAERAIAASKASAAKAEGAKASSKFAPE